MEEELNKAEVRKVLEDANLYEPNMPEDLMVTFYQAVTASKSTASEEDQTRRLNESQDSLLKLFDENKEVNITPIPAKNKSKCFTPKTWTAEKKVPSADVPERNNNDNKEDPILEELLNDSPKDATKDTFGFNEMAKDSDESLNIISYKIKFVPIQNSHNFLNAGVARKAKMLYAYHTKLNKMKTQLARMSFYPAPLPKVTSITDTFPNNSDDDFLETYICRSGRQTKRKIYNYDEDDDSLDAVSHKKTKNSEEQEWLSKATPNKSHVRAKKSETNHVPAKTDTTVLDTVGTTGTSNTTTNESTKPTSKSEAKPPVLKKLSNEILMKRSRLFADTPRRRCEHLFDNLKDEEEKKLREEKIMEAFSKTLENLDEGDDIPSIDDDIITVEDEEYTKKRIVPPIPRRQPINRKRTLTLAPLNVTVNSSTQKKDVPTPHNSTSSLNHTEEESLSKISPKRRLSLRKTATVENGIEALPSTSQLAKKTGKMICPICERTFEEEKIEQHAATCGDPSENQSRPPAKFSRITCEFCDTVVPPDSDFDAHLKECASKRNGNL